MKFQINAPSVEGILSNNASNHADAKRNKAGGLAYEITDSATKLLTMTGGQFFNEPSYYASDKIGIDGLNELARSVVETAKSVTGTAAAKDILAIANFLRNEKKIRTTPAVLFAIAAGENKIRSDMVSYAPKVLKRPDEVLQAFAAYFALYGSFKVENGRVQRRATLPNSFKRALATALSKFDEYQLEKWDSNEWPRIKDVLQVVDRRANFPLKKELAHYFITGDILSAEATPLLAAKKELASVKTWNSTVPALMKAAHATWESALSQFGNRKEVWEAMIDGGRTTLPVMAAVRNLRNMENAGISKSHWDKVFNLVLSHEDNKMLPFRFIAARKAVISQEAKSIADLLLDKAVANIADLPGVTAIIADNSGSMRTAMSGKSDLTKLEAANALAAVLAKRIGSRAEVYVFGTRTMAVKPSLADSTYRVFEEITSVGSRVGGSTEGGVALATLLASGVKVDRIILLSDMQCYTHYSQKEVQVQYALYRAKLNPDCRLYSVDVGGHGDSVTAPDSKVWLSTGFSESIVTEVLAFEGLLTNSDGEVAATATPSMDYVRANF